MNKTEKTELVGKLNETLKASSVIIIVQNKGLTVAQMTELRGRIRKAGAGFRVAKNTLATLALAGTPFESTAKLLVGPTAIAYSSDPVSAAKVLVEFAKQNERLLLIGGAFGENILDAKGVDTLSKMPSLDEIRATIVGMIQTPARRMATLLAAPAGQVARVTGAYSRKTA